MTAPALALAFAMAVAASTAAWAQKLAAPGSPAPSEPIALVDATGRVVARPVSETLVLVAVAGIPAPASIRPIYDADGRTASGMATWQSGGSVLFTSPDCSTGAHIFSSGYGGLRATAQLETAEGVVLFVGAVGSPVTMTIRSILYGSGCSRVTVQQNGLVPVEASANLTAAYPPPLSFR
jgi:hypothetical protein